MLTESEKALREWMLALPEDKAQLQALRDETEQQLSTHATDPKRRDEYQSKLDILDSELRR
ncbi:hypothetical protein [Deinococcus xianganensis]|uniref:Uncharacterized protein n=1 Tax=Deinococcus xianganensis TaxID=1507289 RepID=A0A6I4YKC6_9DEIO|nr:hypothetical protein [Deinococcus xianganensis]MXV21972.1 hypothetical protein [Deinococcus xianganensis]